MKKISILIPCHNEEKSLPLLRDALDGLMASQEQYDWEVMLVNDGSKDNTISVIRQIAKQDTRYCYIDLSRNFGKENAMLAGFDHVSGDCVVIMDADLQHPPHVIPEMIRKWEEGFDDVYGKRLTRGKESWIRKQCSLLFYSILQKSARYEILQNVGDFRLLDRKCIDALTRLRESERYTKGMYCWIGFNKTFVEFETQDRVAGNSSWNFRSLVNLAIEGIVSFTTAPLRFSTFMGIMVSLLAFVYMLYTICKTIFFGEDVQGYPTLLSVLLLLGGVQLLSLGIIGEYIGRIFNETKQRPPYIIQECKVNKKSNEKGGSCEEN